MAIFIPTSSSKLCEVDYFSHCKMLRAQSDLYVFSDSKDKQT